MTKLSPIIEEEEMPGGWLGVLASVTALGFMIWVGIYVSSGSLETATIQFLELIFSIDFAVYIFVIGLTAGYVGITSRLDKIIKELKKKD